MCLTEFSTSSSVTSTSVQFSSSDGNGSAPCRVTQGCSFKNDRRGEGPAPRGALTASRAGRAGGRGTSGQRSACESWQARQRAGVSEMERNMEETETENGGNQTWGCVGLDSISIKTGQRDWNLTPAL